MIIERCCLLLSIISIIFCEHRILAARRKQPDSILEIMNTQEIEQLLAERRLNASRDETNSFIIQNDLDDDFTETPSDNNNDGGGGGNDRYHHRSSQHHSNSRPIDIDFGYTGNQRRNDEDQRISMDLLMQYNDTLLPDRTTYNPDTLAELHGIRGDRLLKSSKNALYITRKEYLKKDWCKTEPLVQRIREHGCLTRTIINRFCYGQCNSFYIPKSPKRKRNNGSKNSQRQNDQFEDEDLTGAAFRSCGFCKPKKFTWITVTLRCPSLVPQLRKKRVQRIKQCRCMAEPLD